MKSRHWLARCCGALVFSVLITLPLQGHAVTVIQRDVEPAITDPMIDLPGMGIHRVAVNPAMDSGRLVMFFPGTRATPSQYSIVVGRAAALGHRVIALSYTNDASVNFDYCPGQLQTSCPENVRREILFGEDRTPLIAVNAENSATRRALRLLQYLARTYPGEGWERFFVGDRIRWDSTIVAGQSQGGGHAAYLAKTYSVARAVLFSATEPAAWTSKASATPAERYFGLVHTREPNYQPIVRSWDMLGLRGALVSVDQRLPPYDDSRRLSAGRADCTGDPESSGFFHNCTSVDGWMPAPSPDGSPAFAAVWDYLFSVEGSATPVSSLVFVSGRIGDARFSYIDPEVHTTEGLLTFQDQSGGVFVAGLDPIDGDFVTTDGRERLLDAGAFPALETFNGPEFGIDADGWAVFYTKAFNGVPTLWRATNSGARALLTGTRRQTVLASKESTSQQTRLLYLRGTLTSGEVAWMDEDDPGSERALGYLDDEVRWTVDARSFTRVLRSGPHQGQIELVDTRSGESRVLTKDPLSKSHPYAYTAPESGRLRILALVDGDRSIGVWEDRGGPFMERIAVFTVPGGGRTMGSPEPFLTANRSFVSFVMREGSGQAGAPAQVWLATTDGEHVWRCDDGVSGLSRSDPETWVVGSHVYVYFNVITPGGYQLHRCGSALPEANLTGIWWNGGQPGWGLSLADQGDRVFGAWFTYDAHSNPAWFTLSLELTHAGSYEGTVYRSTGVPFAQISGLAQQDIRAVGAATLLPMPGGGLRFESTVEGRANSRLLERFAFGELPTCARRTSPALEARNRTAIWWAPSQSGWGLSIEEQGDRLFAAWFTYADDGRSVWSTALLELQSDGSYRGPLTRPDAGTPYFGIAGPATSFPVPVVGQAVLRFSGMAATFDYDVGSVRQSRALVPFDFALPTTRCD